jgi:hypothetical protein
VVHREIFADSGGGGECVGRESQTLLYVSFCFEVHFPCYYRLQRQAYNLKAKPTSAVSRHHYLACSATPCSQSIL